MERTRAAEPRKCRTGTHCTSEVRRRQRAQRPTQTADGGAAMSSSSMCVVHRVVFFLRRGTHLASYHGQRISRRLAVVILLITRDPQFRHRIVCAGLSAWTCAQIMHAYGSVCVAGADSGGAGASPRARAEPAGSDGTRVPAADMERMLCLSLSLSIFDRASPFRGDRQSRPFTRAR